MPKSPKETADGWCQKLLPPYEIRTEITGHCRIADTGEERTDRREKRDREKYESSLYLKRSLCVPFLTRVRIRMSLSCL